MNFILRTLPGIINSWVLGPLMTYVIGPSMFFLPSAVKAHFSGSPLRLLSFLFMVILITGTVRFIASVLRKFLNSCGIPTNMFAKQILKLEEIPLLRKLFEFLRNPAFVGRIEDAGYSEGYNDGFNETASKIEEYDRYQNPLRQIFLKVRDFILTCLYLFVFIEILLAVYVAM